MSDLEFVKEMSFEEILSQSVNYLKELLPDYTPAQGDDIMLVLQAFAYREMVLREYINKQVKNMFLETATDIGLDKLSMTLYGLERLKGSKPYAKATFTLLKESDYDLLIPKGYELKSSDGIYKSYLLDDVLIKAGKLSADGFIELDEFTESSKVKTEIPITPLPFLKIKQIENFKNGSSMESDDSFKKRIKLSLANKSTAGSALTYKAFAFAADKRIEQVNILSPAPGVVDIVYYSKDADEQMQQRIEKELNADNVRPLTDKVQIKKANEVAFDVNAELTIKEGNDSAEVLNRAIDSLSNYKLKIGEDISTARIIAYLMVEGVLDVKINNPSVNIGIDNYSIAVLKNKNISYRISNEL